MKTPVYIKMDAPDQLLLSEGVCQQLGIVSYHRDVCSHGGDVCSHGGAHKTGHTTNKEKEEVKVATRVNMLRTVHLLPPEYRCAGKD